MEGERTKKPYYYFTSIPTSFPFGEVLICVHAYHEECFRVLGLKFEQCCKYLDKSINELTNSYNQRLHLEEAQLESDINEEMDEDNCELEETDNCTINVRTSFATSKRGLNHEKNKDEVTKRTKIRSQDLLIEYAMVMTAPILNNVFNDVFDYLELHCSYTGKAVQDRSKCLRTLKGILDNFLKEDLSDEEVQDSKILGIQFAGLNGQIIGIDLLDDGLYFGLEGPTFSFPAQLISVKCLRSALEALYFFKQEIVKKMKLIPDPKKVNHLYNRIFHSNSGTLMEAKHFKIKFVRKTCFTPKERKNRNGHAQGSNAS
ncbi:hypothetical protein C1646_751404 [Rhizophagus diaphanus]|nr:hypothetical protein C1646_751404 [Rhizophagus diaphanus] [Rhizophagus sp. MUCL 43196]